MKNTFLFLLYLTLSLVASGLPAFGQRSLVTVSPFATSQPLLGRWHQSFSALGSQICGDTGEFFIDAQMDCNGKTVTLLFNDEAVTFDVAWCGDMGERKFAWMKNGGAQLWMWFANGDIEMWTFVRPGDRLTYKKLL